MTAVILVAAIAVVAAVVARVTWRRPVDEKHSIQSHQQTLETLKLMADRRETAPRAQAPPPRSTPNPNRGSAVPPSRRAGSVPGRSVASRPTPAGSVRAPVPKDPAPRPPAHGNGRANGHGPNQARPELVFVDDVPAPRSAAPISPLRLSRGLPRPGRGHRRGRAHRRGLSRNALPTALGVVVLALIAGLAVAFIPSHHRATPGTVASPRTKAAGHARTPPTTTATTVPEVRPTTSTSGSAAYPAPSGSYTVALRATGLCWVEATDSSTGAIVWTGTLLTGQTRSIPATENLTLRLGAADNVLVTLNGQSIVMPTGFASPFDMRFVTT